MAKGKGALGIAEAVKVDSQSLPAKQRGKRANDDYIQLSVLIPKDLKWEVKKTAIDDRLDVSSFIEKLIKDELERRKV